MSGGAQRSRSDARRAPLTARPGADHRAAGAGRTPAGPGTAGSTAAPARLSARTRGPDPPILHEYPAALRHGPLGSPELWAKPRAPTDPCVTVPRYTALAVLVIRWPVLSRPNVRSSAAGWRPLRPAILMAFFQVLCLVRCRLVCAVDILAWLQSAGAGDAQPVFIFRTGFRCRSRRRRPGWPGNASILLRQVRLTVRCGRTPARTRSGRRR